MAFSREWPVGLVIKGVIFSLLSVVSANAAKEVPGRWVQVMATNNLDGAGKTPFHLKMAFQLYDMEGKQSEEGTVEEWWVAPQTYRVVIVSPSLNVTLPATGITSKERSRERYLIDRLLDEEIHPAPALLSDAKTSFVEKEKSFGSAKLSCVIFNPLNAPGNSMQEDFCVEPETNVLRAYLKESGSMTVSRNGLGSFHGTSVALTVDVTYLDKPAIRGKVLALQTFDPAKSDLEMARPGQYPETALSGVRSDGTIVAGSIVDRNLPQYPAFAKAAHVSGTVVMHATISKKGKIEDLVPIATSSSMLTSAATDAVKQWTYKPFLLRGQPTDVDTEISVNFNFH